MTPYHKRPLCSYSPLWDLRSWLPITIYAAKAAFADRESGGCNSERARIVTTCVPFLTFSLSLDLFLFLIFVYSLYSVSFCIGLLYSLLFIPFFLYFLLLCSFFNQHVFLLYNYLAIAVSLSVTCAFLWQNVAPIWSPSWAIEPMKWWCCIMLYN